MRWLLRWLVRWMLLRDTATSSEEQERQLRDMLREADLTVEGLQREVQAMKEELEETVARLAESESAEAYVWRL